MEHKDSPSYERQPLDEFERSFVDLMKTFDFVERIYTRKMSVGLLRLQGQDNADRPVMCFDVVVPVDSAIHHKLQRILRDFAETPRAEKVGQEENEAVPYFKFKVCGPTYIPAGGPVCIYRKPTNGVIT